MKQFTTSLKFTLSSVQRPSGQFCVTITGPASASVAVDTSANLRTWVNNTTVTLSAGGSYAYTDSAASVATRFYRASISSSSQQSCNIVGYVDRTFPTGNSMHGNPFNAYNNTIGALFPSGFDLTRILKWDETDNQYIIAAFATNIWDDANMTLNPGEGMIFENNSGGSLTRSFVGEVVQGYNVDSMPSGLSIRTSIVPQVGSVAKDLLLPMSNGTVIRMISGSYTSYPYTNNVWSSSEPSVSIGEAFWQNRSASASWKRNYLVWP